jgi:hypothetical protein
MVESRENKKAHLVFISLKGMIVVLHLRVSRRLRIIGALWLA